MKHEDLFDQASNEKFRELLKLQMKYHLDGKSSLTENIGNIVNQCEPFNKKELYNILVAYLQHYTHDTASSYKSDSTVAYALRDATVKLIKQNADKDHSTAEGREVLANLKEAFSLLITAIEQGQSICNGIDKSDFQRIIEELNSDNNEDNAIWVVQQLERIYTPDNGDIAKLVNIASKAQDTRLQMYLLSKGAESILEVEKGIESVCHLTGKAADTFFDGLSDASILKITNYIINDSKSENVIERTSTPAIILQCIERFGDGNAMANEMGAIIKASIDAYMDKPINRQMRFAMERWGEAPTVFKALWKSKNLNPSWSNAALRTSMPYYERYKQGNNRTELSAADIKALKNEGFVLAAKSEHSGRFITLIATSNDDIASECLKQLSDEQIAEMESGCPGALFIETSVAYANSSDKYKAQILSNFIDRCPPNWSTNEVTYNRWDHESIGAHMEFFIDLAKHGFLKREDKLFGYNALQASVARAEFESAKELKSMDYDINEPVDKDAISVDPKYSSSRLDLRGTTAIVAAIKSGSPSTIKAVFDLGADPNTKANTGAALAQLCGGNAEIKEIIKSAKANWSIKKEMDSFAEAVPTSTKPKFSPL